MAEHAELMKAIQSMDDRLNKRMDRIDSIIAEFKKLKEDFVKLDKVQEHHSKELSSVKHELNTIKQELLEGDFIITGVPDTLSSNSNTSILDVVNSVFKHIKGKVTAADVRSCYRMRSQTSKSGSSPICVELYSKTLRAAILDHQKKLGPILLSSVDITVAGSDKRKIYIQKRLTPFHQELLRAARQFKVEHNFKFVWVQNTDVLLKESDTSRIIKVQSKADLLALGKHQKEGVPSSSHSST